MKNWILRSKLLPAFFVFINLFFAASALAQTSGDYRSAATGSWNSLATWERYNGTSWIVPTSGQGTPDNADGVITIQSPHTVTVTASISADQVTVSAGGKLTVNNSTLTIANGTGNDLTVNGTLEATGTGALTTTGVVVFNAAGTYIHNRNGGSILTATWNNASNCNITGVQGTVPAVTSFEQAFGNFTWNCPSQSADLSLAGYLNDINGNFSFISTGSPTVRILNLSISNAGTYNMPIDGDYIQSGGNLVLNGTNGGCQMNIAGDFSMSGGTIARGSGTGTINFIGTSTQIFTKSAGTITGAIPFTILNGATVDFGTSVLDGTSATFNVNSGGTIATANTSATGALTTSGANGSVQVGGTRTFSSGANYIYKGSAGQVIGNALSQNTPANLTISNTGATGSNTVTSSLTAFNLSGNLNVTQGNLTVTATNANYLITGNFVVAAGASFTHSVSWDGTGRQITIGGHIDILGSFNYTTRSHVQMTGLAKTLRTGTGPASALSILTLNAATVNANGPVTVNDNFWAMFSTVTGSFSTNGQNVIANAGLLNSGGTVNINGGSLTVLGGILIGGSGVLNGTINLSSGSIVADGITLGDVGGTLANIINQTGGTLTVNGSVNINQPAANVTNSWNINATTATVSGLISFSGSNNTATRVSRILITTGTLNANGGISFTASAAATKLIDMSGGAGTLNLKGTLSVPAASSTLTAGTSGSIFNYNDNVSPQAVNFFSTGPYHNLHINTTGGTGATLSAAITATNVNGNLRVQSGTLNNGGFAIAGNAARILEVSNNSFLFLGGTTSAFPAGFGTTTLGLTSTVNYSGSGNQTIAAHNYGHLTTTLNGSRTITLAGSGTIGIGGIFTAAAGTTSYINTGSTVSFNGASGSQNISAFAFNNLTVNNAAGVVLTGNVSVNGTTNALTFTTGKINTGLNTLTLASGVTVTTATSTKYVNGNLAWNIPTGTPVRTFYIGDATNYTPVTVSFTSTVTSAGILSAKTIATDHPTISSSGITAGLSVNRYWTLTNTTISPVNYTATFNFTGPTPGSGDIDAGVNTSALVIRRYNGSWSSTTAGTANSTNTSATNITGFGDFQIGEACSQAAPVSGGDQVVCSNGNPLQTLTAGAAGGTITWYDAATNGNIISSPVQTGSGTITYYAESSAGNCVSASRTAVVLTINPAPAAPLSGGDKTVCSNGDPLQTLVATASSASAITWYSAATNGNVISSPVQTGPGTITYYAETSIGNCVSASRTAVVLTINPAPAAPSSDGDKIVCSNGDPLQTIVATASSASAITWYDAATNGNIISSPVQTGPGTITYYAQSTSGNCVSLSRTAVMLTINPAPAAPLSGGDEIVCSNGDPLQTLIATASSASAITWYDASSNGNIATPAQIGVGTSTWYAQSSDGTCPSFSRTPVLLEIRPVLATPSTISGPLDVCPLIGSVTPTTFSIPAVTGANFYTWTVPVGTTIVGGQGTTSLDVTFDNSFALTNSMFRVSAEGASACASAASSLEVYKNIPGIPLVIYGPVEVCEFMDQPANATYSIDAVPNATSYTWTVPAGATIVNGQGTLSVNVNYSGTFTSGSIRVTANSNCGNRSPRSLNIFKQVPAAPIAINGAVNACSYIGTSTQVTYSIVPVPNAVSYTWTVPANVTLVSGQGSNSIQVIFNTGYVTSNIKVKSMSNCGNSGDRLLSVTASLYGTPLTMSGPTNACTFIGTADEGTYTIRKVTNATSYIWTVPTGATITSHPGGAGLNDTIVTISFNSNFVSGTNISVQAAGCVPSPPRNLAVIRIMPGTPGIITGIVNACPYMVSAANPSGIAATYWIRKVPGAASYGWVAPAGASITAHPGGVGVNDTIVQVTFSAGFTTGQLKVSSVNSCGTSVTPRILAITRHLPGAPGSIDVMQNEACPARQYTYALAGMPSNAATILWTIPQGGTLISGQGTASIVVSYLATAIAGNVTATPYNNCGNSATRVLKIKLPACASPRPEGTGSPVLSKAFSVLPAEGLKLNVFPNPTVSDFKLQVSGTVNSPVHISIMDMQGRRLQQYIVMPNEISSLGSTLKPGAYMIEARQEEKIIKTMVTKF